MINIINDTLQASIETKKSAIAENGERLVNAATLMAESLTAGGKILLFGNGGSAADAQHIAAEFVNRFQTERVPLASIALTTDSSILTSIGNDYSFEEIFSKQITALGQINDVAIGISTSGNSPNVVKALEAAEKEGMHTIAFTGKGGRAADMADIALTVPVGVTARIQESHILMGHILCDLVDRILFPENF
ncbi:D-sedoheptulose-7-phosphate isomerase [Desulfoluna butyratoxydans]|uniref:Phosphoheptose isomerase n=1 Tax=Desulfoluna butyratoxydans TaxID=231438 RepID=A0A4U8YPB9_9BACT|nr:D-sedoheptulose 7-phosphate isomerase [Desulfoluna butyratoxydans]VFQ43083.1 sugar isomerase (sis) [Desulfoluna butyratoxydans]